MMQFAGHSAPQRDRARAPMTAAAHNNCHTTDDELCQPLCGRGATAHEQPRARDTRPILPPMPRPTIAITCSVGDIRSGDWDEHAAFAPIAYVRAVQRAGARAI